MPKIFFKKKTFLKNQQFWHLLIGFFVLFVVAWSCGREISGFLVPNNEVNSIIPDRPSVYFISFVSPWTIFLFFTILSNMLFGFVTFVRGFYNSKFFNEELQMIVTTYMCITGIVFWSVLAYYFNWLNDPLFDVEQVLLHLVFPVASVWIFFKFSKVNFSFSISCLKMAVFPLVYYLTAWFIYLFYFYKLNEIVYIYPFLNFFFPFSIGKSSFFSQHISLLVLINVVIFVFLFVFFVFVYFLLWKIAKKFNKKSMKN